MKRNEIACVGLRRFATAPVAADAICTNFPSPYKLPSIALYPVDCFTCPISDASYASGGVRKHTRSLDFSSRNCTLSYVRINEQCVNDNDVFLLTPPRKPTCIIYATLTTLAKIYAWHLHHVSQYVPCS